MSTPAFVRRDYRIRLFAVLGSLIVANYLVYDSVLRVDMTRDKVYTLSPASIQAVRQLEMPLHIKGYFTKDLQAPYNTFEQIVRDKLEEYAAHAGGRIEIDFKDPTGDKALEDEARRFGITPAKIDYRSRDQREIRTAYMGVAFVYGDKQEAIPIVRNLSGLEYDITRAIKSLESSGDKRVIGFVSGHGEPDLLANPPQGGVNPLRQALEENYTLKTVDMSKSPEIPDDVAALVEFAPSQEVPPRHRYELDQYLMSGRPIGFFLQAFVADPKLGRLTPVNHGLESLVESYGVKLTKKLIIDRKQNGMTRFPVRQGRLIFQALINYPLFPKATTFAPDSVIVRNLREIVMPFHQALELVDPLPGAGGADALSARALISSSPYSVVRSDGAPPLLDPQILSKPDPAKNETKGPFIMAADVEGRFKSHWSDRPLPTDENDPSFSERVTVKESPTTRILVVGGAEWVRSSQVTFLNMVDWLAQDESLISIRSRTIREAPLDAGSTEHQRLIQVANVVGLPVLFIVLGLLGLRLRRHPRID